MILHNRKRGTDSSEGQPCPETAAHGVHKCVLPAGHDGDHRWDFESEGQPTPEPEDRSEPPPGWQLVQRDDALWYAQPDVDHRGLGWEEKTDAVEDLWGLMDNAIAYAIASERKARETAERELLGTQALLNETIERLAAAERELAALKSMFEHIKNPVALKAALANIEETERIRERLAAAERRAEEATTKLDEYERNMAILSLGMICGWCDATLLKDEGKAHAAVCEKNPMREMERKLAELQQCHALECNARNAAERRAEEAERRLRAWKRAAL